jgi:ABC-type polysaccharide/polyol phosphate transport system ATPase subunit
VSSEKSAPVEPAGPAQTAQSAVPQGDECWRGDETAATQRADEQHDSTPAMTSTDENSTGGSQRSAAGRKKTAKQRTKPAGRKRGAAAKNRVGDALAATYPAGQAALGGGDSDSDELAVRVRQLGITYRTTFEKKPTLLQTLARLGRGQRAVREIEALRGVSFDVIRGTAMGIIGPNGAGKSTLMRAMAGTLPPTTGTVEVWGRVSTLLALGVGFNNKLSGRENIILGGLASGLTRAQVAARADEIAGWTELGDFIDMPMRSYSSGMYSRLAFSVAVHMEPDILMIDEALSTGDAHFRAKAAEKMQELRSKARAMFLVSHGLNAVKEMCNEAMWLDHGRVMERGEPKSVVRAYLKHQRATRSASATDDA